MKLAYNTNGFAHHHLEDALQIIAELGYHGVALTPDVHHLNPFDVALESHLDRCADWLQQLQLSVVIETGARFILSPWRKHQPTLLSPNPHERRVRSDYLAKNCITMAKRLGADVLSFWSGTPDTDDDTPSSGLLARLVEECKALADTAAHMGIRLAFEPEPGMFIDTMAKFEELHARVNHPAFGLTIDVGHLICMNDTPISKHLTRWCDWLWNIHLDDMRPGIHDHLLLGTGDVDFAELFSTLAALDYQGLASVELSRHSHDAVATAHQCMATLKHMTAEK
jgi:sugar phosphate isomerase/epimerase